MQIMFEKICKYQKKIVPLQARFVHGIISNKLR